MFSFYSCQPDIKHGSGVLIFLKTVGCRHKSIKTGVKGIRSLGQKHGFIVDYTDNADDFTTKVLDNYRAVIFLNTTGDILNNTQQDHFERYIQAGGGWIGIHSAADTEYEWPWCGKMVGAYFDSHPKIQEAELIVTNKTHLATIKLPDRWRRRDEWYNYKNFSPDVNILLKIDESTYKGGTNGKNHPMAWYHTYDGGRAFYTGSGHTKETYREELFLQHLLAGIKWVVGGADLGFSKEKPKENRFIITVLDQEFDKPMDFDFIRFNIDKPNLLLILSSSLQ
jgi:cytochrome c